ncbi:binding-protein-dependent transport systems inner membrane component [Thermoanaerobacter italicus Ab9]|uniref:Binding-protein-dependent transport systems inner membrane component n=1 Tax=Thermoanaerobacter italicus (strain DSM 9252 / Ab9) TaxID=580331 RepID=D3T5F9_THEIA|nr:carbohydrate ABC transporter permease [Thermoanaerobacter italicus]ADD03332.1 binding-protein-dependent transport systems inner membrane component [Thermoanaerobacter italicus Ab9]
MKDKIKRKIKEIFFYVFLFTLASLFLFPIVWMIVSSFKPEAQIYSDMGTLKALLPPFINPVEWFTPYKEVLARFEILRYIKNSFMYAGVVVFGNLLVNSMAGYALARFRFPLKNFWMGLIIAIIIVPVETTIIPLFTIVHRLGLVNTFVGLFIPLLANAFNIFLFRQFFLGIPKELEEAALIDGADRLQIFFRIIIPLSKPIFATVAIFTFIGAWNDFIWPVLMLTDTEKYPLQVALNVLNNTEPVYTNQVMAALTISTSVIVLIYIAAQKYIVEGISHTGIKI